MSAFFKNLDLSKINRKRKVPRTRRTANPFPMKLYRMLQDSPEKGWEDIVSWDPSGLSFHVHNIDRFMTDVLPAYFNQTKFKSFQRQLNFYGFHRIMNDCRLDECAYSHQYLIRGNQEMCKKIIRIVGQHKSSEKESSSTSSTPSTSPSTTKPRIPNADWSMMRVPALFSLADEETFTYNDSQNSLACDFANPMAYMASNPSDGLSFQENSFDDTPISLEDPVSFGSTQFDLLSGLEQIMST